MNYFIQSITSKYFDFKDKTGRADFWIFILISVIINFLFTFLLAIIWMASELNGEIVDYGTMYSSEQIIQIATINPLFGIIFFLFVIWYLYMIIPSIAITVRRLNDVNKSIWWIIIYVIAIIMVYSGIAPIISSIVSSIFLFVILIFTLMRSKKIDPHTEENLTYNH